MKARILTMVGGYLVGDIIDEKNNHDQFWMLVDNDYAALEEGEDGNESEVQSESLGRDSQAAAASSGGTYEGGPGTFSGGQTPS
jgi:hypothetical protein